MSWLSSPAHPAPTDWGGVALGAMFAGLLIAALVLSHLLHMTDEDR